MQEHNSSASQAVHRAVERGLLIRPDHCSKCGNCAAVVAHHHLGYERENWLQVIWLCPKCHVAEHRQPGRQARPRLRKMRVVMYLPLATYKWLCGAAEADNTTLSEKAAQIIIEWFKNHAN